MTPLRYLDALWGGAQNTALDKSGPEKRFEIDFQAPLKLDDSDLLSWSSWEPIMEKLSITGATAKSFPQGLSVVSQDIAVVVNKDKLVMTAGSTVDLHTVFKAVVELCASARVSIHWASFMHKETNTPTAKSLNTLEFATLHEIFPNGHPFFLGPITGDHYFCFIHDSIDRNDPSVVEDDVQVNAVFYGVQWVPDTQPELLEMAQSILGGNAEDINIAFGKNRELCATRFLDGQFFATLRLAQGPLGTVVSFETNVSAESEFTATLKELCSTLQPQRFSVVLLLDPQSTPKVSPQAPLSFDKFTVWNATTTELHDYLVKEINFIPSR